MAEFIDDQTKRILGSLPDLDNATVLTLESLPYVRMAMINVSSQWYTIGIHFGVPTNVLDKFRSQTRNNLDSCLTNVIVEWLKNWESKKKDGPPTWRKVVMAVSSRVGGDNPAEARRIAQEYKDYALISSFKDSENVDNRPLTSDSIEMVTAYVLNGVATHWESIALLLGIPYKRIELCKFEESLEERVIKMVESWMGRKYDVEAFGEPTWRKLVEAVASRAGGSHLRLASEIAKDHPLSFTSDVQPPLQPTASSARATPSTVRPTVRPTVHRAANILVEGDLVVLMNLLRPVAYKWDILCLQLGVSQGDLRNIASNPMKLSGAPLTYLQDALYGWMQHRADSGHTIAVLCDALRAEVMGENLLAEQVEIELKAHKGIV